MENEKNENEKEFESKNIRFNLPVGIKNAIDYLIKMDFYESLEHFFLKLLLKMDK